MRNFFSLMLICCTACAFAAGEPIFEETTENGPVCVYSPFAAEEPIFEEDGDYSPEEGNGCDECDDPNHDRLLNALRDQPEFDERETDDAASFMASCSEWRRFKATFGPEKLFVRFPQPPAVSQSNTLLTAYAYDCAVLYSLSGYFPPKGNFDPIAWFNEILVSLGNYPFTPLSHVIFQDASGIWIMDYVAHDYVQNLIIKGRAMVTPFNGYTIQCIKPNGMRDHFEYFLDNIWIKCGSE